MKKPAQNRKKNKQSKELFFLILSCSGGAGHIRAAEALHRTSQLTGLPIRTEHYDVLDFTTKLFKRLYSESYLQMVNRAPELWGYLYQVSERKPYEKKGIIRFFDRINYKKYIKTLIELNPDAIICTHFLPYISISNEMRKRGIKAPIFSVTTDFDVHQLWIDPVIEKFFVHHKESAWQLQSKHVPPDKIRIAGIPVMPEFMTKSDPRTVRKKLGVETDRFTILVLSGGFGVGRIIDTVKEISGTLDSYPDRKFNLIVVCGKNEKARNELKTNSFPKNINPYIFGFVNNVHELMDASNILISKAGGLTSSEAMAKSLPMLIIDPIPGQESRNTDLIVEAGAGWKAINLANLSYKLRRVIEQPALLERGRKSSRQLARPYAASTILSDVYSYVAGQKRSPLK